MNQKYVPYIVGTFAVVVCSGTAFLGGMKYQQIQGGMRMFGGQMRLQLNQDDRQFRPGGMGQRQMGLGQGFRPITGEVLSLDEESLTVKMADGSSKIVLLSEAAVITKATNASKEDLKAGENITVFGTQNQDGSVTAQSVAVGEVGLRWKQDTPAAAESPLQK